MTMINNNNNNNLTVDLALCAGRHEMPDHIWGAVFEKISDPTDVDALTRTAYYHIWYALWKNDLTEVDPTWDGCDETPRIPMEGVIVNIYVTGLTVALIAAINACKDLKVRCVLYHFNRETGDYFPQEVF